MELSLPKLAEEILANPTWIEPYTSTDDPTQERATIKHLHWSLPTSMTTDNDIFQHNPQNGIPNALPYTLCNIPWNNNAPPLLTYLQSIVQDWECVQQFLQVLHTYRNIIPAHRWGWSLRVQFPIAKHLMHTHPLYPNDYIINTPTDDDSPYFQLYYADKQDIPISLPNRIPQNIVHAIQRLSQHQIISRRNYKSRNLRIDPNDQSLFKANLISKHPTSQHTTIKRMRRWKSYYPDIPIPIPQP